MSVYENEVCFLQSCTTAQAKVSALDLIIDALLLASVDAGNTVDSQGYNLDDGQTKIKREYRSPSEIVDALTGFERMRNYYIAKCTGSVIQLRNQDTIKRRW